jgi:hypothetical protein
MGMVDSFPLVSNFKRECHMADVVAMAIDGR